MINRQNYEIWFLDFAEGRLSEDQTRALMDFLAENEDLKTEWEEMEWVALPADNSFVFDRKELLKQPTAEDLELTHEDNLLIGHLEGDLSEKETKELNQLLSHSPQLQTDQKIYQATVLKPKLSEKYPAKNELKRKEKKRIPFRLLMQMAAALILLMALVFALRKKDSTKQVMPIVEAPKVETNKEIIPVVKPNQAPAKNEIKEVETIAEIPTKHKTSTTQKHTKSKAVRRELPTVEEVKMPPQEPVVVQVPKSAHQQKRPTIQAPPKPILEPQLPEPKPVIAHTLVNKKPVKLKKESSSPKSNSRRIALNKPKQLIEQVLHKGIRKVTKTESSSTRLSIPEAVVATVGKVTNSATGYKHKKTPTVQKTCIRIGKFKFSRVRRVRR